VFRRRRRDGENDTGLPPDDQDYPAADDELAEEDYDDAAFDDAFDETAEEGYGYADEEEAEAETTGIEPGGQDEPSRGPRRDDLGDPATWTRLRDSQVMTPAMTRSDGPWDSASEYPAGERIDFGSLLIPARDGYDVQVFVSEEEGISIAVVSGDSGLQLQPFAAPRSSGLWHEVLPEIAEEVARAGGQSQERAGPFGPELLATVVPQGAGEHDVPPQPLRFMGADGPRWFLRGLISGPAATDAELARPFEDIFADVVVVRGEHAEPQRKPLDIRLPDEAREVLESQLAEQAEQAGNQFDPFERGPEITETR
jgi:Protein of unknown function (DUF3710)